MDIFSKIKEVMSGQTSGQNALDFIAGLSETEFHSVVEKLIQTSTPPNKHIIDRLFASYQKLKKQNAIQSKKETENQQKLLQFYESYKSLETMYKEEHAQVLSLTDEKSQLQVTVSEKSNALEALEQKLQLLQTSMTDSMALLAANRKIEELERQKKGYKELMTKQGIRRKELEDLLMEKDIQAQMTEKKVKELEAMNLQLKSKIDMHKPLAQQFIQVQRSAHPN